MNMKEAQKIADKMSFSSAVYNALNAKCVPYRKATKIKISELLNIAKDVDDAKSKGCDEVELSLYYNGWNDGWNDGYIKGEKNMQDFVENRCRELGIDYTLIFTCNNADNLVF